MLEIGAFVLGVPFWHSDARGLVDVFDTARPTMDPHSHTPEGLLTAEELLKTIWPNSKSRPSLRWLREQQARRTLPHVKCGRLVFFDAAKVRQVIAKRFTVEAA